MAELIWPALFALFAWWASTGLIVYLDGLPRRTFKWSMAGATAILAAALYGVWATADDTTVAGAYLAFTSAVFVWGWIEISFYMDYVTGPRKAMCAEGCSGWRHFGHAIGASLYHEFAILAFGGIVAAITWNAPNKLALWSYLVLWWMHQSAKLNVFLGVPNIADEFVPAHLTFLKNFLRRKPMNWLFPISVTVSTVIAVFLAEAALAADATAFETAAYSLVSAIMILAIAEHWFLVLPLPVTKLWNWSLSSHAKAKPFEVDIVAGFLGAGKTTVLKRLLASTDPDEKTLVLVNDFSELGVDSALIGERGGAGVAELANGCICCSLRRDLSAQLEDLVARHAPQRVLIEPSGVADTAALLRALADDPLKPLVKGRRLYTVIDAAAFLADYARMPAHFEAQADIAAVFLLNKADLVGHADLETVKETLRALNPTALIVPARYGRAEGVDLRASAHIDNGAAQASSPHPRLQPLRHGSDDAHGLESWSAPLAGEADTASLRSIVESAAAGEFGDVLRLKGLVRSGRGWLRFDLAGGKMSIAAVAPNAIQTGRVAVIGRGLHRTGLQAAFGRMTGLDAQTGTAPALAGAG